MAVSGECYLSLHFENASATRGACVRNCGRPYLVRDAQTNEELLVDNEYIMSSRDLCTIDKPDQVVGVDVLKMECISKGADYVYTVAKCYRNASQAITNNCFTNDKIEGWITR